jgi:hypothetical protein
MALSKRLRYEILRRDAYTCRYCGAKAPDVPLRVDHVTPVALGGSDNPTNLVTACEPCNSGKSSVPADAAVVAGVDDDALRWAAAMGQAAENLKAQQRPKLAYRDVFQDSWNEWTYTHQGKKETFELPANWKASLDTFREAGLPEEVWSDIIDKAMTNPLVKADNTFRYCCGIAWRMVRELQEEALRIVGPERAAPDRLCAIDQAVIDVWSHNWTADYDEPPASADLESFARSVADFRREGHWVAPDRLISASIAGVGAQVATIQESLAALVEDERCQIVMDWCDAWVDLTGEAPDNFLYSVVKDQIDELAGLDLTMSRTRRAALLAAYHQSATLHHGLRTEQLELTGITAWRQNAIDLWSRSFHAAVDRWPSHDQHMAFAEKLTRVANDGDYLMADVFAAAATAGGYQDPDLSTCLPRHLSVFEAAALPLGVAA